MNLQNFELNYIELLSNEKYSALDGDWQLTLDMNELTMNKSMYDVLSAV